MPKFATVRQLQTAIFKSSTLRVTVGATGNVSAAVVKKVVGAGCVKATFWGFDSAGNNIVEFKALS